MTDPAPYPHRETPIRADVANATRQLAAGEPDRETADRLTARYRTEPDSPTGKRRRKNNPVFPATNPVGNIAPNGTVHVHLSRSPGNNENRRPNPERQPRLAPPASDIPDAPAGDPDDRPRPSVRRPYRETLIRARHSQQRPPTGRRGARPEIRQPANRPLPDGTGPFDFTKAGARSMAGGQATVPGTATPPRPANDIPAVTPMTDPAPPLTSGNPNPGLHPGHGPSVGRRGTGPGNRRPPDGPLPDGTRLPGQSAPMERRTGLPRRRALAGTLLLAGLFAAAAAGNWPAVGAGDRAGNGNSAPRRPHGKAPAFPAGGSDE